MQPSTQTVTSSVIWPDASRYHRQLWCITEVCRSLLAGLWSAWLVTQAYAKLKTGKSLLHITLRPVNSEELRESVGNARFQSIWFAGFKIPRLRCNITSTHKLDGQLLLWYGLLLHKTDARDSHRRDGIFTLIYVTIDYCSKPLPMWMCVFVYISTHAHIYYAEIS